MKDHQSCLLCSSRKLKVLKSYENHGLVRCSNCSFVFTKYNPSFEELDKYYSHYSYTTKNNVISPITQLRYLELLEKFEKYRKTNRLLDIGCGRGAFLQAAKNKGWDVVGTEISDEALKINEANDIKMYSGNLNSIHFDEVEFDVITSFEVIEHINNPSKEIDAISRILREGGLFYVTTPNFNSFSRYLLQGNYNVICVPEHLSYYSSKTLNYILSKNGFKKIQIKTTGINLDRINPNTSHSVKLEEKLRVMAEEKRLLKYSKSYINFVLNILKLGDAMKGYFVKVK